MPVNAVLSARRPSWHAQAVGVVGAAGGRSRKAAVAAAMAAILGSSACERAPSPAASEEPSSSDAVRGSDVDVSLFPNGVDVEALDPAVRLHLADRLAAVAAMPLDLAANAALADAWLAHDRSDLAVAPARVAASTTDPSAADPVTRLVLLGDALAAAGDVDGAIEAGTRALAIRRDDPDLLWRVAGWSLDAGDLDAARRLAVMSAALAPRDAIAARMLATVLLADGRAAEAVEALSPFAGDPRDGETQYLLSRALASSGRAQDAEIAAIRAGDARPTFVDPWLQAVRGTRVDLAARLSLALDLASAGRRDDALAATDALRALYPDRRELDATTMGVHAIVGEHEAVLEIADRLIAADPAWMIPRTRAAFAALALARRTAPPDPLLLDRAARDATVLVETAPNEAEGHDLLGRVHAADGRWEEALVALQRAMELEPSQGRHRVAVGECLVMTGRPLEAIRVVNEMDRIFGRSVDAALVRVRAMAATGRAADARALLEQCRKALPNHPGLVPAEQAVVEAGG